MDLFLRLPRRSQLVVAAFFALLLLAGILLVDDYGISWDEKTQYSIGVKAYDYLAGRSPWTTYADWRYFGTTFELLLTGIEAAFMQPGSARSIFIMRHFVTFLSFCVGAWFLFLLGLRHFRRWVWALLPCLLLALSPRIFGHAFYNSKDIPTLALFVVCAYTLLRFLEERSIGRALLHAAACALLITVRLTGVFFVGLTLLLLTLDLVVASPFARPALRRAVLAGAVYLVGTAAFTVALWPYLWSRPVSHFLEALQYMSSKAAGGLYLGDFITEPVWHWVPVWIAVTTPFLYTAFFLLGAIASLANLVASPVAFLRHRRTDVLVLSWFFLPLLGIIALRAGLYDDWRHVFFLYPAFLLLAVGGMRWAWNLAAKLRDPLKRAARTVLAGAIALSCVFTAAWMVRNHPLQSLYFSIPARYVEGNFELDYWGISFREGIEYLLTHSDAPVMSMFIEGSPGWSAPNMLLPGQRRRVAFTADIAEAEFVIDNFRGHQYGRILPENAKLHSVTVGGVEVLAVYRNPGWQAGLERNVFLWPPTGLFLFIGADDDHP